MSRLLDYDVDFK